MYDLIKLKIHLTEISDVDWNARDVPGADIAAINIFNWIYRSLGGKFNLNFKKTHSHLSL